MTGFGDSEPEDSWDADDHPVEQLGNLHRRIVALRVSLDAMLNDRERARFEGLHQDLAYVIERLRG